MDKEDDAFHRPQLEGDPPGRARPKPRFERILLKCELQGDEWDSHTALEREAERLAAELSARMAEQR